MLKTKQLIILSDGSSFKNISSFPQIKFKTHDFKKVFFKNRKKLFSNNKLKLNEIVYRKQLFI